MSKIYQVRYRADATSFDIISAEIVGGTTGDTIYRIEAPFDSTVYTCGIDFLLATGEPAPTKTGNPITTIQVDSNGDGNTETFWRYQYEFDTDVTSVSNAIESTDLIATVVFTDEPNNVVVPMNAVDMIVNRSVDSNRPEIPPDEVARLDAVDATKRDRLTANLTGIDFDETNYFTTDQTSGSGQGEHKVTTAQYDQHIVDLIGGVSEFAGYPTDGDSGITPQFAFGGGQEIGADIVSRTVDNTDDSDFDKENPVVVPYTIQASGVWENAFQSVYPIGFGGISGTLNDTTFTQGIKAKTDGLSYDVRTMYFVYSDTNGIAAQAFHTGAILNFSTTEFSNQSKLNSVIEFSIDLDIDERIYTLTQVNGTIGTVATAEIEDDSNTLSNWQLSTSAALQGKADKIPNAVEDNLVCQQSDGNMKDCGIAKDDVARLSQEQSFAEKNTFEKDVDILNDLLVTGNVQINGDFNVTTPGTQSIINVTDHQVADVFPRFARNNPSDNIDLGIEFELGSDGVLAFNYQGSGDKQLRFGKVAGTQKVITYVQESATANIAVYNTTTRLFETQTPTQIKTLLELENVTNKDELDLAISNATQIALDEKITFITAENEETVVATGKILNGTGNTSFSQNPTNPDQIDVFTPVGGTGTGKSTRGEATIFGDDETTAVSIANPFTIDPVSTEHQILFEVLKQSNDLNVMTINASTNSLDVDFVINEGEPLEYKTTPKVIFLNTNTVNVEIDFITKVGISEVDRQRLIIPASITSPDGVDNTTPFSVFETSGSSQLNATYFVEAPTDLGVSIVSGTMEFLYLGVIGENVQDRMFKPQYDTNDLLKIDEAQSAESWEEFATTNPQDADRVFNKTGALFDNHTYKIGLTAGMTGDQMRVSSDNESSFNVVVDRDDNPALGTDYNDISYFYALFDLGNSKLIIQSLDKIVDDVQTLAESNETRLDNANVLDSDPLAMPVGTGGAQWTKQTEMNVFPDSDGWTATDNGGTVTLNSGILNMLLSSDGYSYAIESGNLVPANIKRVETRCRINTSTGPVDNPAQAIFIRDGVRNAVVFLETNQASYRDAAGDPIVMFTGDLTGFNIIRIEYDNSNGLLFYVNGSLEATIPYASTQAAAVNSIDFGGAASSTDLDGDVDWDYVYYQLDLASNPDLVGAWEIDGTYPIYYSTEITTVLTIGEFDKVNPVGDLQTQAQLDSWNNMNISRIEWIDANTLKFFAIQPNVEALNYQLGITRKDGGLT